MANAAILSTLKDVGDWSPISLLSTMANLTLSIYDLATTAQGNKVAIKSLANDTVETAYIVAAGLQFQGRKGTRYTSDIGRNLEQLLGDLEKIKICIEDHRSKRKWYNKLFGRHSCDDAVAGYQQDLSQRLGKFGLKDGIERGVLVSKLLDEQNEFFLAKKGDWMSKTRKAITGETYGSMIPNNFERGSSAPNSANGTVKIVQSPGNHTIETSSKTVTNTNSGQSLSFSYTGK
ncbi:hypothetical protein AX16_008757 [Volvariella volvacea WC 439]|nr:hypothetical protein AX16_008757 [Volvariella volvacea WC 439]